MLTSLIGGRYILERERKRDIFSLSYEQVSRKRIKMLLLNKMREVYEFPGNLIVGEIRSER
jgi:hypothetical protein